MTEALAENRRILVVDDNPAIHDDFQKILCNQASATGSALQAAERALFGDTTQSAVRTDYELDFAHKGEDALAMVERALQASRPYAMTFVDVRMPNGWDGIETSRRLWQASPDLQIVLCTAYSDYAWKDIVRQLGTSDSLVILKKPFDNVEVLQLALSLTKKWWLTQQSRKKIETQESTIQERTRDLERSNERLQHEIHERRQWEAELRESEARLSAAFHASPVAIEISTLADGRFVDVNEAFLAWTGFTRQELIGRTSLELGLWPDQLAREAIMLRFYKPGAVRNVQCRLRRKSGDLRDVLVSAEPVNLGAGSCVLFTLHDISDRIQLEEQLRQAQKMEAVGQLASGVAHDFNNMLTVITGHAQVQLMTPGLDPNVAESLREISEAAQAAANVTRQLLAFSRRQVLQAKSLDLNALLKGASTLLRPVLEENVELVCRFAPSLPTIHADSGLLEQVIMNLALNARDAMPNGGRLVVSTSMTDVDERYVQMNREASTGSFVCLTVTDTGCGMDAVTMKRIFEPFFTTKEVGKGTGLGRSTVYGIVKQHRGWVEVSSLPRKGTTFRVLLPVGGVPRLAAEPVAPPPLRGGRETILVVEDEARVRSLVRKILEGQGYHVLEAASGPEALSLSYATSQRIDLLLTDIVMPSGMSGQQVAAKLLAERRAMKVVYSSGYSLGTAGKDPSALKDGAYLQKPYRPETLVRLVRDCLDGNLAAAPSADEATAADLCYRAGLLQ